ncbi:MAG: c-type cytochrome domain-containing protein [Planctomycetaceae bacterium]
MSSHLISSCPTLQDSVPAVSLSHSLGVAADARLHLPLTLALSPNGESFKIRESTVGERERLLSPKAIQGMRSALRSLALTLMTGLLTLLLATSVRADVPTEGQVAELKQRADAAGAKSDAAAGVLKSLREKVVALQQQHYEARRSVLDAEKRVKDAEAKIKAQDEAVKKAEEALKGPAAVVDAAAKVVADMPEPTDDAKAKLAAAQEKLKAPAEALAKAQGERQQTQQVIETSKQEIEQGNALSKQHEEALATANKEVEEATTALAAVEGDRVGKQQELEAALKQLGRWVSFSEEIAPVFQQRCLACHNARTAKGRLNLESYASLMKGGESGDILERGKGADSLLCIVLEDGSMPQDADPLSKEQIQLVQKWIDFGASLDAGVSPTAPLFKIVPRRPQPAAPETYRVPIPVTAIALSPNGASLATSGYHEVLIWSAEQGTLERRISNVASQVYDIAYHSDNQRIAIAAGTPGQGGEVKLFDTTNGNLLLDLVVVEDAMFSVAFSPDGTQLAASGADRAIRVFDLATGRETVTIEDHADWVLGVAWSPDGNQLASASRDKTAKVFNAKTGEAVSTYNGQGDIVYDVTFLPDSKQVATAGADKQVRIWNAADGKEVRKVGGFGGDVLTLSRGEDGRLYAGSSDKTVRVINPADGKILQTLTGHADWVYAVSTATSLKRAASGSYDGEVRVWNLDDAKTIKNWKAIPTP